MSDFDDKLGNAVDKFLADESAGMTVEGAGSETDTAAASTENNGQDPQSQPGTTEQNASPGEQAVATSDQKPDPNKAAQQQPQAQPARIDPRAGLTDPITGRTLPLQGADRRVVERAFKAERDLSNQLRNVQTELAAFKQTQSLPTSLGLSNDEVATAYQLSAAWKKDPVGTIAYLLEQARADGHNLDAVLGNTNAIDTGAIKRIVAEQVAPLTGRIQLEERTAEANRYAAEQIEQLTGTLGTDAWLVNADAVAKVVNAAHDKGMNFSVDQAYFRFEQWCRQNGYDPHQNIDDQIEAARNAGGVAPVPTAAQPVARAAPPPHRTSAPVGQPMTAMPTAVNRSPNAQLTGNESTRDLVKEAMRENGFNIN